MQNNCSSSDDLAVHKIHTTYKSILDFFCCVVFGRPFVKRFALCYQTVVILRASVPQWHMHYYITL